MRPRRPVGSSLAAADAPARIGQLWPRYSYGRICRRLTSRACLRRAPSRRAAAAHVPARDGDRVPTRRNASTRATRRRIPTRTPAAIAVCHIRKPPSRFECVQAELIPGAHRHAWVAKTIEFADDDETGAFERALQGGRVV